LRNGVVRRIFAVLSFIATAATRDRQRRRRSDRPKKSLHLSRPSYVNALFFLHRRKPRRFSISTFKKSAKRRNLAHFNDYPAISKRQTALIYAIRKEKSKKFENKRKKSSARPPRKKNARAPTFKPTRERFLSYFIAA
jgi:hypothetical protein